MSCEHLELELVCGQSPNVDGENQTQVRSLLE